MPDFIKLNLINRSQDSGESEILIFQKNLAASGYESALAWRVIQHLGIGDNHPFLYPLSFSVSASDAYGNFTPQLPTSEGQVFQMVEEATGEVLQSTSEHAVDPLAVEVRNDLKSGVISANAVRDGKVVAIKSGLAPGQKAVFRFEPRLFLEVVSQIGEGDALSSPVLSEVDSELDLTGIHSADIVMSGGGPGPDATRFEFKLENVNRV